MMAVLDFYKVFGKIDVDAVWLARDVEQNRRNKINQYKNESCRDGDNYYMPKSNWNVRS